MRISPLVTLDLVTYLETKFPNKCPEVSASVDEVRALAGEQRVIAFIKRMYRDQDRKSLMGGEGTVTFTGNVES